MKPTVIAANQNNAGGGGGNGTSAAAAAAAAGINIPINREYLGSGVHGASPHQHQQHYAHQPPQHFGGQPSYGSPRQQQQQVPTNHQQQQHFEQPFGFEPDMNTEMENMFPRSRLGRLHNDPFAGFGGTHFGFPQFSTMGRRGRAAGGANSHMEPDDDFFNRLPSEFRQYIPEGFGSRRTAGGGGVPSQSRPQQQQPYYQQDFGVSQPVPGHQVPQSPSKRLCDAAIQTDDPTDRSEVDCAPSVNLNQHGLRNTVDMGVKSAAEQEQGLRSHSAPPPEQQQLNQQYQQQQEQTHQQRPTPPPQFGTQTSPPVQPSYARGQQQPQPPQFHKTYYPPQQQAHRQQKQDSPPPQTPGGSYVRTIPIFVEGRTDPIINAHKEIPNQNAGQAPAQASAQAHAQAYYSPPQQQQRSGPLNTQQPQGDHQQQADAGFDVPPQTPHTVDSIKKIQDIQRDVLDLMGKVEKFKGSRQDKEYAYLDEMLTRNLLKLDTIDTNGKDSIRLARKEAIKCIQASVNVLDAKAEENARAAAGTGEVAIETESAVATPAESTEVAELATPQPLDATKIQEPIPLPPPPSATEGAANAADLQATPSNLAPATEAITSETISMTQSSE